MPACNFCPTFVNTTNFAPVCGECAAKRRPAPREVECARECGPLLLSACRDALALLEDPDADGFDATRVELRLRAVIARAEGRA